MNKTDISKIVFNVRGKKLELSKDEAKELKDILGDLFGETKVVHEWHSHPWHPWHYGTFWCGSLTGYSNTISNASDGITSNAVYTNSPNASDTLYLTVN